MHVQKDYFGKWHVMEINAHTKIEEKKRVKLSIIMSMQWIEDKILSNMYNEN